MHYFLIEDKWKKELVWTQIVCVKMLDYGRTSCPDNENATFDLCYSVEKNNQVADFSLSDIANRSSHDRCLPDLLNRWPMLRDQPM